MNIMKVCVCVLTVLFYIATPFYAIAQKKTSLFQKIDVASKDVRIVKRKPHIFISYMHKAKIAPLHIGDGDERIWLRVNNNSKWKIKFCSNLIPKEYGDTGVEYLVERYRGFGETPETGRSDSCAFLTINSGKSIIFSIPSEHLNDGLAVKIKFRYNWETDLDGLDNSLEPNHFVYFYSKDVPER